jgi:hypothetical protein
VAKFTCQNCGQPIELYGATYAGPVYQHSDPQDDKNCNAPQSAARDLPDPYLYLAGVKSHLADHRPMDEGDIEAWDICDHIQSRVFQEARRG